MSFRESMPLLATVVLLVACISARAQEQSIESFKLKELCSVSFSANTQAGQMKARLGVCRLESDKDSDVSLCVVVLYEREYGACILKLLELAHSPVIERKGTEIFILYTSGVNTTCVAAFSVSSGVPKFVSIETIRWNDHGVYRTSESFPRYAHLLERREASDSKLNR